jgi:hypothetical protein
MGECCLCCMRCQYQVIRERCPRKLTYLSPFRFLYRFPQTSHLNGFSFSIPSVPGYGVLVSGLTIEKVPSPFSCNCWVECP